MVVFGLRQDNLGLAVGGGLLFWMVAREERAAPVVAAWRQQADSGPDGPANQTREEFIDAYGRRYVVVTKVA